MMGGRGLVDFAKCLAKKASKKSSCQKLGAVGNCGEYIDHHHEPAASGIHPAEAFFKILNSYWPRDYYLFIYLCQ